jgi:hypothetical protein
VDLAHATFADLLDQPVGTDARAGGKARATAGDGSPRRLALIVCPLAAERLEKAVDPIV